MVDDPKTGKEQAGIKRSDEQAAEKDTDRTTTKAMAVAVPVLTPIGALVAGMPAMAEAVLSDALLFAPGAIGPAASAGLLVGLPVVAVAETYAIGEEVHLAARTAASYAQEDKRFKAGNIDSAFRPKNAADPDKPLMTDYKHLAAIKGMVAKHVPEGKIDGKHVESEFDVIDFTKQENYMAYRTAMSKEMLDQWRIKEASSGRTFRWFGGGGERRDMADSQLHLFASAEKEFGDFEQRALKYNGDKAQQAADGVAISSHGVNDPAPGKKDTAIQAPAVASKNKTDKTEQR